MNLEHVPMSPSSIDDSLDIIGFGDGSTTIKQIDKGLHPDGENFVEFLVKSRVAPEVQPFVDHILARAIKTGKLKVPVAEGAKLNSAEALALAHQLTQISVKGQSRREFVEVLSGFGRSLSAPFRASGQRHSTYGQPVP